MSERRIHVVGTAQVAKSPDFVVLNLILSACNPDYSSAMKIAAQQVEILRETLVEAGFSPENLKTVAFNVDSKYEREDFRDGNAKKSRETFVGFDCRHDLALSFDFDAQKLDSALSAVKNCLSQPKISVVFTLKDPATLSDKLLKAAARDAQRKAKILCAASGVKLGNLLEIRYQPTVFDVKNEILVAANENSAFNFRPNDLIASDSADFLWEIE